MAKIPALIVTALTALLCMGATAATADPPTVESVVVEGSGNLRIAVTLSHGDTGWDHYADGWRVETEGGEVLGTRDLVHPHVDEQPFTRSLSGVSVPESTDVIYIRARDNRSGWAEERFEVPLE